MIEVNSIEIPDEFLAVASDWHGGQSSMLYAVASTGGLTLGSTRPWNSDADRPMTDQEWYWRLWSKLAAELRHCVHLCENRPDIETDVDSLKMAAAFADRTADQLAEEYGIEI